jgi:hypothetical protein
MKQLFIIILAVLMLCSIGTAQWQKPTNAGNFSVVGEFSGLSYIGVTNFNGGFGGRLYLAKNTSVRGTVGGTVTSGSGENWHSTNVSGALLFDLFGGESTSLYFGPQVYYTHAYNNAETYTYSGVVGVQVYKIFSDGLSFAFEYPLGFTHDTQMNQNIWTFGSTSGSLIINVHL